MRILGLTGGIGTGKSTVASMLRELGATVVDADQVARDVVAPGTAGLQQIQAAFGDAVLTVSGELDRAKLGEIVFGDPEARKRLEQITHPLIMLEMGRQMQAAEQAGAPIVFLDVPLLYETGNWVGMVAKVIVVYAPADMQVARVVARNGLTPEHVRARMSAQMDIEEKRRRGDHVIDNSGSLEQTRAQVAALWRELTGHF